MNRTELITTRKEKSVSPNTTAAASLRQETLNEQIDAFFKSGGKITKLPDYDDGKEEVYRPAACGFGGELV